MSESVSQGQREIAYSQAMAMFHRADKETALRYKWSVPHGIFMAASGRTVLGSLMDVRLWVSDYLDGKNGRAGEKIAQEFNDRLPAGSHIPPITRPETKAKTDDPKADRRKTYAGFAAIGVNAIVERKWVKAGIIGVLTADTALRSRRQQANRDMVTAHEDEFKEHGVEIDVGAIGVNKAKLWGIALGSTVECSPLANNEAVSTVAMSTLIGAVILGDIGERIYHKRVMNALDELAVAKQAPELTTLGQTAGFAAS